MRTALPSRVVSPCASRISTGTPLALPRAWIRNTATTVSSLASTNSSGSMRTSANGSSSTSQRSRTAACPLKLPRRSSASSGGSNSISECRKSSAAGSPPVWTASNARRASSTFEVGRRLLLEPRCSERRVAVEVELDPRQAAVPEGHHRRRSTLDGRLGSLRCRLMPSERYEMLAAHAQLLDLDRVAIEWAQPIVPGLTEPVDPVEDPGEPPAADHGDLEIRPRALAKRIKPRPNAILVGHRRDPVPIRHDLAEPRPELRVGLRGHRYSSRPAARSAAS